MKNLKKPLRKLLHDQGNLHDRVNKLRTELDEVQKVIDMDPINSFNEAKIDEERFLKQKAKIEWLDVGDSNSSFFHKSIKSRNQRSRIDMIKNAENMEVNGTGVPGPAIAFGSPLGLRNDEIKLICLRRAMFDIGDDKAPGPDGYTSAFFKKGWDVVGQDVCRAVHDFFVNGKLLKEVNHTFLALIPKILTNRIIAGIKEVVSENQSAFVPGRRISDNILITQELMHNYHRDRGPPRRVRLSNSFRFHKHCEELRIINIRFADDLFIFARGDVESAKVVMDSLNEFKLVSGLVPSIPKSTVYFCNIINHVKSAILNVMPFLEGRLQLCNSVISSMQVYWASVLSIPFCIIDDIQQLIRGFLWCNGKYKEASFKGMSWDVICLPKSEGGLGHSTVLSFQWCVDGHSYLEHCHEQGFVMGSVDPHVQAERSFFLGCSSQSFHELGVAQAATIERSRETFFMEAGREGYNLRMCVADIIENGSWVWPQAWCLKAPKLSFLFTVPGPYDGRLHELEEMEGKWVTWHIYLGEDSAWDVLRPLRRGGSIGSRFCVGLPHCIPLSNRNLAGMDNIPPILEDITAWFSPMAAKRSFDCIVGKLLFAAAAYHIWIERNNRLFKNVRRSPEEIKDIIVVMVRLKIATLRFKNKPRVIQRLSEWKMPNTFRLYG
ncbi:hypothetical protein Tco_1165955 [Tanacetum coccineum]